ncbi:hypothetical protein KsCSTR_20190 [Candidatus Kuenenia stuttgartiensis]|uniref:Uncharacterized protein n=1 Tax=Kuenenia stuttgartiensis TaxID=174633 RepID=Q1Q2R3_KUEST|nr:hypothetical protein KsCSTR_20190 [Candidatus Kuenenia stuttgartiensis]CAJ74297.1 unknown protein [Candidatus Kuenenia stuttgartiensis]
MGMRDGNYLFSIKEHSRFFVTVCVIGAKQRCQWLILLYVSLKHGRSNKKPGMHMDQPHKGMKAAKEVASLSPAGGGLRGWNCLRSAGKRDKFVFT